MNIVTSSAESLYLHNAALHPLLSAEEEKDLLARACAGERYARHRLIECNQRLVIKWARHYQTQMVSVLDLIQEGNLGLIHAIEKFDTSLNYRFSTYATNWITGYMRRYRKHMGIAVTLPFQVSDSVYRVQCAMHELYEHLQRKPTDAELATALQLSVEKVILYRSLCQPVHSLNAPITTADGDGTRTRGEMLIEQTDAYQIAEEQADRQVLVRRFLTYLTPAEQQVVILFYGLQGRPPMSCIQIGQLLHVSAQRISHIYRQSLEKLQLAAHCLPATTQQEMREIL